MRPPNRRPGTLGPRRPGAGRWWCTISSRSGRTSTAVSASWRQCWRVRGCSRATTGGNQAAVIRDPRRPTSVPFGLTRPDLRRVEPRRPGCRLPRPRAPTSTPTAGSRIQRRPRRCCSRDHLRRCEPPGRESMPFQAAVLRNGRVGDQMDGGVADWSRTNGSSARGALSLTSWKMIIRTVVGSFAGSRPAGLWRPRGVERHGATGRRCRLARQTSPRRAAPMPGAWRGPGRGWVDLVEEVAGAQLPSWKPGSTLDHEAAEHSGRTMKTCSTSGRSNSPRSGPGADPPAWRRPWLPPPWGNGRAPAAVTHTHFAHPLSAHLQRPACGPPGQRPVAPAVADRLGLVRITVRWCILPAGRRRPRRDRGRPPGSG